MSDDYRHFRLVKQCEAPADPTAASIVLSLVMGEKDKKGMKMAKK